MNEKEKKKFVKELFYKHCITEHHTLTMFNEQFENAIKEYDKAIQVQALVRVQIAEILRMCEISLPNARLLNANTQYKNGWEDAFKHIIDYVNNLND